MTALSPGRFGPPPDDALLTRGLWQYVHCYGPVTSAPKATTPAAVPQPGLLHGLTPLRGDPIIDTGGAPTRSGG
jgi:hypothetical protein